MNKSLIAATLGLITQLCGFTNALAQTPPAYRLICQAFGVSTREELADRQGHALTAGSTSCRVEGGPMNGGITTISTASEVDGDGTKMLVTHAITRKPGSIVVTVGEVGKSTLVRGADGKVTGTTGSGSGRYVIAIGDGASLSGRKYTYTVTTTAGQAVYAVDVKPE
jgi:hypothetical protein